MKLITLTLFLMLSLDEAPVINHTDSGAHPSMQQSVVPDFAGYTSVQRKKSEFFGFMLPKVKAGNGAVLVERRKIQELLTKLNSRLTLSEDDISSATRLFQRYGLNTPRRIDTTQLRALLNRVDTVPASLVLAQSANESGWGTSRFARQGNNFFGIWCFSKGCGITPLGRDPDAKHEVARFDTVDEGVRSYIHLINTHPAYQSLRDIRAHGSLATPATGMDLAEGLKSYSERGLDYVRDIQLLIRANNLQSLQSA